MSHWDSLVAPSWHWGYRQAFYVDTEELNEALIFVQQVPFQLSHLPSASTRFVMAALGDEGKDVCKVPGTLVVTAATGAGPLPPLKAQGPPDP